MNKRDQKKIQQLTTTKPIVTKFLHGKATMNIGMIVGGPTITFPNKLKTSEGGHIEFQKMLRNL